MRNKAIEAIKGKEQQEEQVEEQQQESTQQAEPKQPRKKGPNFLEKKMMQAMGLNNVAYEQSYNFTSSMVMDIVSVDSLSNKENMQYTTLYLSLIHI